MKALQLEDKFNRVNENLIGVWKFQVHNKKPLWCATFHFGGYYFDVEGFDNVGDTLNAVYRKVMNLKKNGSKNKSAKKETSR